MQLNRGTESKFEMETSSQDMHVRRLWELLLRFVSLSRGETKVESLWKRAVLRVAIDIASFSVAA